MEPKRIILHHSLTADSETVSWGAIRAYHRNVLGWADIGYHFGIEKARDSYEIFLGRMPDETGAHCSGHNHDSIGICFIGNFDLAAPPREQWILGVKLVRFLCDLYKIPFGEIHGHREYSSKTCPGKLFDGGKFIRDVTAGGV